MHGLFPSLAPLSVPAGSELPVLCRPPVPATGVPWGGVDRAEAGPCGVCRAVLSPVHSLPTGLPAGAACVVTHVTVPAERPPPRSAHRRDPVPSSRCSHWGFILRAVLCGLKAPSRSSNHEGGRPPHTLSTRWSDEAGTNLSVITCFPLIPSLS